MSEPIGHTVVKLERVEDGILYISGPDAFDGTPVIDIKPFIPSIDCVESSRDRGLYPFEILNMDYLLNIIN